MSVCGRHAQHFAPLARFRSVETMTLAGDMTAAGGGEERLEQLYDRFSARLFRFALRVSRDDGEARDYVHDAYMRAARDMRRVPQADNEAMAWLIRVVVNLARDRYRRTLIRDAFAGLAMRRETHDRRLAPGAG